MKGTLVSFSRGADIVVIAVLEVLLCIARPSVAGVAVARELATGPLEVPSSDEHICRTKGCLDAAETFRKNMDRSVNPCDNFYNFACGRFVKSTVVPGDKTSVNSFSLISDKLNEQLSTIIKLSIQPNEPKPFRLVKNFYKACMNEDAIEAQSLVSLREILNRLGGWPVIIGDRWNDSDFSWKSSISKIQDAVYKIEYLINIYISIDVKNSTKRIIYIDHPDYGIPNEYLVKGFEDKYVQAYYKYMVDIAVILGANKDRAMAELKESLQFELKLLNISMPWAMREKNQSIVYNPMTFTELKNNYSSIPWTDYFAKLLPSSDAITEDEVVSMADHNYITSLVQLMEVTPKRVVANYLLERIVDDYVPYLNRDARAVELALLTTFKGVTKRNSRQKACINAVSSRLPLAVGALYVRSFFTEEAKSDAVMTITNIKKHLAENLRKVEWMDDTTRKNALEKLAAMSGVVAYYDEILKDDMLDKVYENLELSGENYLKNFINYTRFSSNRTFSKLHKPVEKNDWTTGFPAIVNAWYQPSKNFIQIPAGILQGVFFGSDRPKYTNYGGIGFVIGHEITHGFDRMGSQYDKDGNLANWWATTTRENFDKRAECMIHQYGNYTVNETGLKLNGEKTLNENIADNGGLKAAYLAYDDWVHTNPPEKQLPGLNYTSHQMFWLSAANSWCTKYTNEAVRFTIRVGVHSPSEFRIIGPLSNMPQFSKDFNCPIGSKMNPIHKCTVW